MHMLRHAAQHAGQLGPLEDYLAGVGRAAAHITPMQYVCAPVAGRELFRTCRRGVLNYVILRPATAVAMWLTLVTHPGRYQEGALAAVAYSSLARHSAAGCVSRGRLVLTKERACMHTCVRLASVHTR